MYGSLRCAALSAAWLVLGTATAAAAPDAAILLNGLDNTLSHIDLNQGTTTTAVHAFGSYPGHGAVAGGRYAAAISGLDQVRVYDLATLAPVDTLHPGAGTNPYAVVGDEAGNLYVTLLLAGEVVRFDASGVETGRVAVGRTPQGLVLHEGRLFVANTGFRYTDYGYDPGTVSVVDPATMSVLATVPVGTNPQWAAAAGGEVHVVCTGDYFSTFGEAHVIDANAFAPLGVVTLGGSPGFIALAGGRAYLSDYSGGITAYDVATRAPIHDAANPILFGGDGYSAMAHDGAGTLYVTLFGDDAVAAMDLATESVAALFAAGDGPQSIALRDAMPVPVRLLAFSAAADGAGGVRLRWRLAETDGLAAVHIERSDDGTAWRFLGRIAAGGGDAIVDPAPPRGAVRYRLTALLRDGTTELLGLASVVVRPPAVALRLLANPVRGRAPVRLDMEDGSAASVRLVGAGGRTLREWDAIEPGSATLLDVTGLSGGRYFMVADGGTGHATVAVTILP